MATCSIPGCQKLVRARGLCNPHYIRARTKGDPLAGGRMRGEIVPWLRQHSTYDRDNCLIWPFSRTSVGYGNLRYKSRDILAHRFMCELANGPAPTEEHVAAHSCGNGNEGCVNPRHLRWATNSENESDKIAHGTSNRGTGNGQAILNENEVLHIVALRRYGKTLKEISVEIGRPITTISAVCNGHNWSHVTGISR